MNSFLLILPLLVLFSLIIIRNPAYESQALKSEFGLELTTIIADNIKFTENMIAGFKHSTNALEGFKAVIGARNQLYTLHSEILSHLQQSIDSSPRWEYRMGALEVLRFLHTLAFMTYKLDLYVDRDPFRWKKHITTELWKHHVSHVKGVDAGIVYQEIRAKELAVYKLLPTSDLIESHPEIMATWAVIKAAAGVP